MQRFEWFQGIIAFLFFFILSQVFIGPILLFGYMFLNPGMTMGDLMSTQFTFSKIGIVLQSTAMFISFILAAYLHWFALKKKVKTPFKQLFDFKPVDAKSVFFSIIGVLAVASIIESSIVKMTEWFPFIKYGMMSIMQEINFHEELAKGLATDNVFVMLGMVTVVALMPGFGEEFFFRGYVQRIFQNKLNVFVAIGLSGGLFGAIHLIQEIGQAISAFLVAFYLGYVYYKSNNLWIPVICHAVNNGLFAIILFVYPEFTEVRQEPYSQGVIALLLLVAFISLYHFYKLKPEKVEQAHE